MKAILIFILTLTPLVGKTATAVKGCGYLSTGEYLCSDSVLTTIRKNQPEPQALPLRSASLTAQASEVLANGHLAHYLTLDIQYCRPPEVSISDVNWKKGAEGQYRKNPKNPTAPYLWSLGGSSGTIKDIHFSFTALTTSSSSENQCVQTMKTIYLRCELVQGYDVANCNFHINGSQTLSIEISRYRSDVPSIILY